MRGKSLNTSNLIASFINNNHSQHNKHVYFSVALLIAFIVSLFIVRGAPEPSEFPKAISDPFKFEQWIDAGELWLKDNFRWFTKIIASGIEEVLYVVEGFLINSPWLFILMLLVLPALYYGGLSLAILTVCGGLFWGGVGMWEEAMQTLALMGLAVVLSVFFGIILGVLSSQSNRFEAVFKPIFDTMQTMPAFVYLLPAVFFFGIGGPPAILATMIYAIPPVARLTNLGIRQIPLETLEAAHSFGASRLQTLFKVQIPIAIPSILLGINQTIMMALGLVVLATFIGAEGLGAEVWKAITKLKVGWSVEAGLCIVFMAIIFDRLSCAMGKLRSVGLPPKTIPFHLFPQSWEIYSAVLVAETALGYGWNAVAKSLRFIVLILAKSLSVMALIFGKQCAKKVQNAINERAFLFGSIFVLLIILLFDAIATGIGSGIREFPDALKFSLRDSVDQAVASLSASPTFSVFTKGLRATIYLGLLHPLDTYLIHLPWWIIVVVIGAVSWISVGRHFAIICIALLFFIGACDLWEEAMLTLSSVLVSVGICFIIGVPLGILAAQSNKFDMLLRPILDAMQTLPSFVYLIPVLMLFGGNVVSAVIATVIYAMPPVIRCTTLGISQIPVTYTEVASSFGARRLQTLKKVKIPMALPSLMLGLNQGVMMALAMQVVTPLIGGGGLGRDVFNALNTSNTGYGLAAGTGVVLLAIILDRLSQAWSKNQREALGL